MKIISHETYKFYLQEIWDLWETTDPAELDKLRELIVATEVFEDEHFPIAIPEHNGNSNLFWFRLTVDIGSRRAIPVRALPLLKDWTLYPETVAKIMARDINRNYDIEFQSLAAYRIVAGKAIRVKTTEWQQIVEQMSNLAMDLGNAFRSFDKRKAAWDAESFLTLPAGAFIWADEFIDEFSQEVDEYGPAFTDPVQALRSLVSKSITVDDAKTIFEGFDHVKLLDKLDTANISSVRPATSEIKAIVEELSALYINQWKNIGYEATKQDIAAYLERQLFDSGYRGHKGSYLDRQTFERHYLVGVTGNRKGHKLKGKDVPSALREELPPQDFK